jgi:hypothetical protein
MTRIPYTEIAAAAQARPGILQVRLHPEDPELASAPKYKVSIETETWVAWFLIAEPGLWILEPLKQQFVGRDERERSIRDQTNLNEFALECDATRESPRPTLADDAPELFKAFSPFGRDLAQEAAE